MQATISKVSLAIVSLLMFAACAKKAEPLTSEKVKPKKEAAADTAGAKDADKDKDKTPQPDAPRTETPPADSSAQPKKDGDNTVTDQPVIPKPTDSIPAPVVSGAPAPKQNSNTPASTVNQAVVPKANSSAVDDGSRCPIEDDGTADSESDKKCSKLLVEDPKVIEACLLQKVTDYSAQLKAENREINNGSLNWVMYRSKEDCHGSNLQDQEILKRVHLKLQEVGLKLFAEAAEEINAYVAGFLPKPTAVVAPPVKVLRSTEYHFVKVLQYGSRDFRQPKDAINYSIGKIQRTINLHATNGDGSPVPMKTTDEWQKDIFSNLSAYSFGFELKSNKMYTLEYKDETGSLTLDYSFFEGSLEAFKKGESAKVVLTKASWLKVIEFETQKLLAKHYAGIPRSSLRISLSPLDPPTARTCSIGKGYILGYRAIACLDPEYRVRIQVLDTVVDTGAPTSAE